MNSNLQKRFLLFLCGCIPVRLFLVYIAKTINVNYLPILGYIAVIISCGFMYIFLTGSRKSGIETFGAPIWWNNLRPLHALFYAMFAYNAIHKNPCGWIYLFADVILGLASFLFFHINNNLKL